MTSLVLSHVSNGMLNFAPTYLYVPSITSVLPFVPSELVELFSSSFVFAVSNTPIIPNMPITIIISVKSFTLLSDIYLPPPIKYSFSQSSAFTFINV